MVGSSSSSQSSKRICRPKNGREVLSDVNEKLPDCIELSDSRSSDSSCDSSPIVKRHRKTKRKVLDPSKIIHSSENVEVYSSLAKISFEKIHSEQFNHTIAAWCVDARDDCVQRVDGNQKTGETEHPESPTRTEEIASTTSSPSPPTPPPRMPLPSARLLRSNKTELRRNITRIESNIRKFDKVLNSSQPPTAVDDNTATSSPATMTTTTTGGETSSLDNSVINLDNSVISIDDDDGEDDDCCVCGEGGSESSNVNGSVLENRRIVVMVKVNLEVKRFQMNYNDTFCKLFADLAHDLQVGEDQLILLHNDMTIHQNETPASIYLQVPDILVCLVSKDTDCSKNMADRTGPDIVQLVIQSNGLKRCNVNMSVGKFETFQGVLDIFRKQQSLNSRPLKLYFDGELLDTALTPVAYDIEDGDCLDLVQT